MLKCFKCNHQKTRCIDSRDHGSYVRRRRECLKCGFRYSTCEVIEEAYQKIEDKSLLKFVKKQVQKFTYKGKSPRLIYETRLNKNLEIYGLELIKTYEKNRNPGRGL